MLSFPLNNNWQRCVIGDFYSPTPSLFEQTIYSSGSRHLENLNFPENFSEKSQTFRERNLYKHDAYT